jgi:hypothetical protein
VIRLRFMGRDRMAVDRLDEMEHYREHHSYTCRR